jgi:AcrR family transcriptional regulator
MPRATTAKRERRTQEERSAETTRRLLDATIECLIDRGYSGTTTTVIAERAGVSRGAQLHHFPTKAELVAAAVEHLTRRIGDDLQREAARLPADADLVAAAIDLVWARFATPLFPAWLELLVASRTDSELRKQVRAVEGRLGRTVEQRTEEIFGADLSSAPAFRVAMDLTLSLMYGMALQHSLAGVGGRNRSRRDAAMLEAWKRIVARGVE